tara:strand:+ start:1202 stop:1786 length:585 start_codon:yes stop_codon:yes gene_type:complete
MTRPIYYKSFRSRKFEDFSPPKNSLSEVISKDSHIILDIGFGTGDSTIFLNKMFPGHLVCGIEAYKPGIKILDKRDIPVEYGDAVEIIEKLEAETISQIYLLFPDPWQKNKHRKRRLLNDYSFEIINRLLIKGGLFHFTTDNINYAFEARDVIRKLSSKKIDFSKHRGSRPITKYEMKGLKKRNFIFDLLYFKS